MVEVKLLCGFLLLILLSQLAIAQEEKEHAFDLDLHGYVLESSSVRATGERPRNGEGGDFILSEERLRLELSASAKKVEASFLGKVDLVHDAVAGDVKIDAREAYLNYRTGAFDFRIGRHIMTWGVGDLVFINDIFPKDWISFLAGRPMEYFKLGGDGMRITFSSDVVNAEGIIIPFFKPDTIPTSNRFFLFDPFPNIMARSEKKPALAFGNTELGLRLYRQLAETDISLYAHKGFWRTPSLQPNNMAAPTRLTLFYPNLSVYGASAQRAFAGGVISAEVGYYDSQDDRSGGNPLIPNSEMRWLLGFQKEAWTDFTIGAQYFAELMQNYDSYKKSLPVGFPRQDKYRQMITLRLTRFFDYQMWKLSLFTFYGLSERDFSLIPEISHKLSDHFSFSVGAHIFGGKNKTTTWGQYYKDDNIFLSLQFDF